MTADTEDVPFGYVASKFDAAGTVEFELADGRKPSEMKGWQPVYTRGVKPFDLPVAGLLRLDEIEGLYPDGPRAFTDPYNKPEVYEQWVVNFARNLEASVHCKMAREYSAQYDPTQQPPEPPAPSGDDLDAVERFLASRSTNIAFIPADANYLSSVLTSLIKEVREHRTRPD